MKNRTLLAIVLGLLLCTSAVFAKDGDSTTESESSGDSGDNDEDERELSISNQDGTKVEFESKLKSGGSEEQLKFLFRINDNQLEVAIEYKGESKDGEVELKYRTEFDSIIEFNDTNGDGVFQESELVSSYNFERQNAQWDPIVCGTNSVGYNCTVRTSDGLFWSTATLVGVTSTVDGQNVKPTSAKIDVHIDKKDRTPGTILGLSLKFKSEVEQESKEKSDEEEEGFSKEGEKQVSFGTAGFFSWVKTASVNGKTVDVLNTPLETVSVDEDGDREEGEGCNRIVYSFNTLETGVVYWDPKVAIMTGAVNSGAFVTPFVALIAAACMWLMN